MLSGAAVIQKSRDFAPGLAFAALGATLGFVLNASWSSISPLTAALIFGAILGNVGVIPKPCDAGLKFASRQLLRAGIVLLGLQLSFGEVADLGSRGFIAVVVVVAITFFGTQFIARKLGVSPGLGLLTATGYSICGVSAISAMTGAVDGDEEDATYAIALVTLFGSISIFLLPALASFFDMGATRFGMWAGSSVHDVAQVIATSGTYSADSLSSAVIVKLTRVVLLAPLVALYAYQFAKAAKRKATQHASGTSGAKVPILPMFIGLFLVAVAVRTTGVLSDDVMSSSKNIERTLLALALVGLGAGVNIKKMRALGSRPLLLGTLSYALVLLVSLVTIRLIPLTL
jgi:uncharacterized integral membrane protein (TIGR00698 family)